MFRKLHIQMTFFAACIISVILGVMTMACLLVAGNGMKQNSYTAFSNNANSCIFHLESQTLLAHQWIWQAEQTYGVRMKIRDNGLPIFADKLRNQESDEQAFEQAARISRETQGLDPDSPGNLSITKSTFFEMEDAYACTALIPKSGGVLSVIILYPLDTLKTQILDMRVLFGAAAVLAAAAMTVFAWFFIKKMIHPLEEGRRRQTEFVAAASHELRSPLAVILSCIQAMDWTEPEGIRHYAGLVEKEGLRMSRLVNDMLSLANADNQSWSIRLSGCELDTVVLDTYEKYEPLAAEKGLRLQVRIPEEPVSACRCDSARIAQVLGILLENALSYVPAGGRIRLELRENAGSLQILVSDNGPGIPDPDKEAVFRRFYRADTARGDKQHFGLGLCIAREIMNLHDGNLTVADTPGGGATFTMTLPKRRKAELRKTII